MSQSTSCLRSVFGVLSFPDVVQRPGPSMPESGVLERLLRLENAVFGSQPHAIPLDSTTDRASEAISSSTDECLASISTPVENERRQAAQLLDLGFTRSGQQSGPPGQVLDCQASLLHGQPVFSILSASEAGSGPQKSPVQLIPLVAMNDALSLLQDFTDNPVHLLPVIHQPTVRSTIVQLYDGLAGDSPPRHYLAHAALALAIAATSAFFYHPESSIFGASTTPEQATQTSMTWLKAALDLTDLCQRDGSVCLEHVQARVILSHLLYNIEGCSSRFRFMYSSCVSLGRDMSLHLIDSSQQGEKDDETTKEMKRRLWWYIASTDW